MVLCDLKLNSSAYIKEIKLNNTSKLRLYELGLIEGTKIKLILKSKGINAYLFRNTQIAIRNNDASKIIIGDIND